MSERYEVVVAGAGMVGLSVAALLAAGPAAKRLQVSVVDAGARPAYSASGDVGLRVSAISLGSVSGLQKLGVWDAIRGVRACSYERMHVWDARCAVDGPEALRFEAAEFALPELGYIVENGLIQQALLSKLVDLGVDVRFDTPIATLETLPRGSGCRLGYGDGTTSKVDLLVGADGAGSTVRRAAGIPVKAWRYPQSALVTHLRPEFDHAHTAWQRFLVDGPLALLPLADGRVSVVWSTTPDLAKEALAVSDEELGRWLTDASDRVLGKLTVDGPRGAFPLKAQHAVRYAQPGVVLVGDAAHSVHPLAGQGVNLGIADAEELARTVADALAGGEHPGDLPTLRRYERGRKGANQTMLYFTDMLNRLFLSDSRAVAGLRTGGMRIFNRIAPLRRRAVQVALGIPL
ncbi:MAG: UbiH/UbiF/VisC/COQ6 family ubiquinone biosynthesis hydroxylase [Gammaproteobacteria bacterium]|nr:UbiH/UbiF/VisC/COQ6 family ubiquinone biosynthesis hydroxylase [Gammaproteobacteria bacterium]MDH4253823.1 UbiH/UbiF/VisC/COQ6 family ubiquinone biosynthesis hydroxylase [Gammaproteobacteria bacterium]MDH5311051.1 UbiH/UbiF/VisC/COQ6 family ubiquinone biosynthesis hydroxylase [Gammaproteobacteria bacterium]